MPRVLPFQLAYRPLLRRPAVVLALGAIVTCIAVLGLGKLNYDHNLLHLQPAELASVQWEHRLLERSGRGAWFAVSIADDAAAAAEKKRRFEALAKVERVEEMASLLPAPSADKLASIERIQTLAAHMPIAPPEMPLPSLEEISAALGRLERMLEMGGQSDSPLGQSVSSAVLALAQSSRADCLARLGEFQRLLAVETLARIAEIRVIADPAPLTSSDLPPGLEARFVGKDGRHLLRVYARDDIWEMNALAEFVMEIESVDGKVTGHPVQTYYASREMQDSYVEAALYSFLAVAVILLIDLRSPIKMSLAFLPLGLGVAQMFGLLGWLGISLNAANMICLPLIMGIGIDGGVHVVHDYLRHSSGARKSRYRMSRSTGAAVILSSATTIVGFGVMAFGRHQGLRSLGQVLTLGVTCSMLSSLFMLPAAISWFTRRRGASLAGGEGPLEDVEVELEVARPKPQVIPRRRRAA